MNNASKDLFYQVIEEYEKGNFLQALQFILPSPTISYDSLASSEPLFKHLVNYIDACAFHGVLAMAETNQTLCLLIESDKRLSILLDSFVTILKQEHLLLLCYISDQQTNKSKKADDLEAYFIQVKKEKILTDAHIKQVLEVIPFFYQNLIQQKLEILGRWKLFSSFKPRLAQIMGKDNAILEQPWHVFSYPLTIEKSILGEQEGIPVIFFEPLQYADYVSFLAPYKKKSVICVFETVSAFFQYLQFEPIASFLLETAVFIYLLEFYPQEQFQVQDWYKIANKPLKPILLTHQSAFKDVVPLFIHVLEKCLLQSQEEKRVETLVSDWLFQINKRLLFRIQAERYGKSRCLALGIEEGYKSWFSPYKGLVPKEFDLGPLPPDYVAERLQEASQNRKVRVFAPKFKIRIAHVVPQLVDGGHAPTKLIKNLLLNTDKNWFDLYLISTERLISHALDYPITSYQSLSSNLRGVQTIQELQKNGIKVLIDDQSATYEGVAQQVSEILKELGIDIVVFHGPDEVNELCGSLTDVPIRLLFEHGTLPTYPCFDLVILSTEEAYQSHQAEFRQKGMESCFLFFSIDVREGWQEEPYSKQELGFPSDSFIMTTISNHLDNRLSNEMCHAIGQILQRSPKAFYAPIGPILDLLKFRTLFAEYGVSDRVIFLGHKDCPSQYARSMDLYLNEFPFGSCLGMLDAMAAGCPIVSMYDEQGPQQARYGAAYFGIDWVIKSGKVEDYIDLACQLIKDKTLYQEWSERAKQQYEKRVNVKLYAHQFEKIIENFIDYQKAKSHSSPVK